MKEGLIKDTYELIIKEIQTVITVCYLLAVAIGMIFNYKKYAEFGINIFDYGDVFDFLIAPFSDFYIILFAAASTLFISTLFYLDYLWQKKWPKSYSKMNFGRDKKKWFKQYRMAVIAVSFITYLFLSASFYGKYTKEKITNQRDITITLVDNEIKKGKLIGKTKEIVFLLNDDGVFAIPLTSVVKQIKLK
ncbi:hypothetical protein [Maribacter hydrothermalis]|uniref:Uncharacterized protein n=1 Tax=Maribacter hydrothermalis TaxID=1836467 RepID=A0A1B7Z427_9FLAO|nr:hypothetical protein [Maribacter hydrothermalis]APQ17212.1 hypothetical protein BTR34_07660 [Maribacter hydrothermalis]OBR37471.1 hypothetical protein A9200_07410 [Maribacter hydrothermalis]